MLTSEYTIEISEKIEKSLRKIPRKERSLIIRKIDQLALDPRPQDCKKLQGHRQPPLYRVRSGMYRVVYTIKDSALLVLVIEIGHRKDIYQKR